MPIIDLSIPLENDVRSDPEGYRPHIEYLDHHQSLPGLQTFFPGLAAEDMPSGEAWAIEHITLNTHNGTHLDAPWHFASTMDGGVPAMTIDEVPLDWCFRPGVKLDFRHFPDGYVVTTQDVISELDRISVVLKPFDIVLVNTRAGKSYGSDDYIRAGCGMGRDATMVLLEQGVCVTGTDAWSWDTPFEYTRQKVDDTGDYSLIWEGHKARRQRDYCHMEKLHNLEALPPTGFDVACFPVKIKNASAGWTRAVAIFED